MSDIGLSGTSVVGASALLFSNINSLMKTGKLSVFDTQLTKLYLQNTIHSADASVFASVVQDLPGAVQTVGGQTFVTVDITAKNGDGASLLPALQAAGLQHASSYKGIVSGVIDTADLGVLSAALAGPGGALGFARESAFSAHAGVVTTQADISEHADLARANYGVTGAGITVGVLSDSFNTSASASTHMAQDIASGDLPAATTILQDAPNGTDEGRAMAQLVHDIAPGASIDFATADFGQAGFANNILALAAAGAKVIVDDVIYYNELAYQEGPIAQAIDQVAANGVSYFSAAGNDANNGKATGYEGAWSAGATYTGGGETTTLMHFAAGQDYIPVTLAAGESFVLQWANPGASAGGAGATSDLDMFLTNQDGSVIYAQATTNNIGGDPVEILSLTGGQGGTYYLRVGQFSGAAPSEIKLMALANGGNVFFTSPPSNTNTGNFYGHAAALGAMGVGAAFYGSTPAYGVNPPIAEPYSSTGPDNVLFDNAGNSLGSPSVRIVSVTAPDGGNTSFFGSDISQDADFFPNFFGTSAAAPGAAAVAALMLQNRSTLSPTDMKALLQDAAVNMGAPGIDSATGAGLVDANVALSFANSLIIGNAGQPALTGTHLNDTLLSSAGNDVLDGGAGVDTVSYANATAAVSVNLGLTTAQATGGAGTDTIKNVENLTGSAFNDTLQGNAGDNVLDGGAGVNTASYAAAAAAVTVDLSIVGPQNTIGAGNDTLLNFQNLTGSAFNDTLAGTSGDNVIDGGLGTDTVSYANAGAAVTVNLNLITAQATGGAGNDTLKNVENLTGSAFGDVLTGSAVANVLAGGAGDDTISGGAGNDTLLGGDGNDLLLGGAGNDAIDGGIGINTASYADATSAVTLNLMTGVASGGGGTDALANIQNLVGSAFNDTLQGSAGDNVLDGAAGVNTVTYANATAGVVVDLSIAGPQNTIGAGNDTLLNVQNLTGSSFNDTLAGTSGDNVIDGGLGTDTVTYANAASGVTVNLSLLTPQVTGGAGTDTIKNVENVTGSAFSDTLTGSAFANVMSGGAGDDTLSGGSGNDTLSGGDGNDLLFGGAGNDALDGGTGVNTANYSDATLAVTLNLMTGLATGGGGVDTLVNIQNLVGSAFNDTLQGDGGDNVLDGAGGVNTVSYANATAAVTVDLSIVGPQNTVGAGNDTLLNIQNVTGSAFNDTLAGTSGDNVIDGGVGVDTLTYAGSGAGVTMNLSLATAQITGGSGTDTVRNIENLTGTDFNDVLTGSAFANILTGGAGDDTISGAAGNDTIYGGDGNDLLLGGAGNDTIDGGAGINTASYADATLAVTVNLMTGVASGGGGIDTLTNIQNLVGSAFNDTLQGSSGDNVLDGAAGVNTVTYANATAGVVVDLSIVGPQDTVGAGHDTLLNVQNLTGSAFNDTLAGTSGDNVIDGGLGVDTLSYANAAAGVTVSLALATAQITGGAGSDTVKNFENLTGSAFNDTLSGGATANTIAGGDGGDRITGSGGADVLWGGNGADTFIYAAAADSTVSVAGQDQVMDFSHTDGDLIDLSAIDSNSTVIGDQAFTLVGAFGHHAGELIALTKAGGFLVEGDTNGDGLADFAITVLTTQPLVSTDFIL